MAAMPKTRTVTICITCTLPIFFGNSMFVY
jgi:hypothetical protein